MPPNWIHFLPAKNSSYTQNNYKNLLLIVNVFKGSLVLFPVMFKAIFRQGQPVGWESCSPPKYKMALNLHYLHYPKILLFCNPYTKVTVSCYVCLSVCTKDLAKRKMIWFYLQ